MPRKKQPKFIQQALARAAADAHEAFSKRKMQLVFLPYITPEFPENSGRVEVDVNSHQEAWKLFHELNTKGLIEEAKIYHADEHVETLL